MESGARFMYNSFATASSTYKHLGLFNELVKSWLCHMRRFIFQLGAHYAAMIVVSMPIKLLLLLHCPIQKTVFINANYIQLKFCTLAHNQGTNMLLYTQDAYRCTRLHRGMYVFVCTDACTCMYAYMICTHTCAYMRVYARICTKTCTHMQTCMRAYEHVHARIRYSRILYARACTHKHTARASIHTRAHTIFTYVYILIHAYMHTYYTYMHAYKQTNIQQQHTHTYNQTFIHKYMYTYMHT